jgi:hypothetical protein
MPLMPTPIFEPAEWQMTRGERAALEGVLAATSPDLAIEIGTAQGGSLARVAAHCEEVHSFDLEHDPGREWPSNAVLHSGDSHALLPEFLAELTAAGRSLDFALVDGDHTADGVRRDMDDLLTSPTVSRTVILIHDTLNEIVREGLRAARIPERPGVVGCELDFVAGHLSAAGPFKGQLWGGLGLVLVDKEGGGSAFGAGEASPQNEFEDPFDVFSSYRGRAANASSGGVARILRRLR